MSQKKVSVGLTGNRGYTMQDIGKLDARITQLEYYTALNMLSLSTQQLSITNSSTGLERFKNGIFADPLNDSSLMRTTDTELAIGLSPINSMARPYFSELLNEMELDDADSIGVQATGKLLTLSYNSEFLDGSSVATATINCTQSYWNFKGIGYLFPDFNMAVDQTTPAQPQIVTIDQTAPIQAAISAGGFKNIDTTQGSPKLTSSTPIGKSGISIDTYTANVTQTTTSLSINPAGVSTSSITNDNIINVASLPYMEAKQVAFVATGLRPNTLLVSYFNNKNVSIYCAPATLNSNYTTSGKFDSVKAAAIHATAQATDIITQNGNVGDKIYSNDNGEVYIMFYLPAGTFPIGSLLFTVCDSLFYSLASSISTEASATYTSTTLATTHQQQTYNIITPSPAAFVTTSVSKDLNPISFTTLSYTSPTNNGGTSTNTTNAGGVNNVNTGNHNNNNITTTDVSVNNDTNDTADSSTSKVSGAGITSTTFEPSNNNVNTNVPVADKAFTDANYGLNSGFTPPGGTTTVSTALNVGDGTNAVSGITAATEADKAVSVATSVMNNVETPVAAPAVTNTDPNDTSKEDSCFLAGSMVAMADGSAKPIELIQIGDSIIGAFGEINNVVALDRTLLGNRSMFMINKNHSTTSEHTHVSIDKKFYSIETIASYNEWGKSYQVITSDGIVEQVNLGLAAGRVQTLENGIELKTILGSTTVNLIEEYTLPSDTQLYNLSVDGSHTYHVQGYAVTGWPREDDFDYDTWTKKESN